MPITLANTRITVKFEIGDPKGDSADTNAAGKIYYYDIVIAGATNNYTVVQDELEIKESVRYN